MVYFGAMIGMKFFHQLLGPKSKYDRRLPYTYEARIRIIHDREEYNSCFSDTICGLVEYLHAKGISPTDVSIYEVYLGQDSLIEAQFFSSPDNEWIFRPDICSRFEKHYPGHSTKNKTCSFRDRDHSGIGP